MKKLKGLKCVSCGHVHAIEMIYECEHCRGSLDIIYDYESIFTENVSDHISEGGIWRHRSLLPIAANTEAVSLGEGNTPLLRSTALEVEFDQAEILIKNEAVNPTLSFKDRPLAVALTVAKQFGVEGVVTASTGNTGVAAAAYAARAGLPCRIYVPKGTPKEKLIMMEMYGAKIELIEGTFSDAYLVSGQEAKKNGWFNLTSTFLNPYAIEGDKTLAYEIYEQYGGVPDWIIIPIGAGPLLVSCYKGFRELQLAGKVAKLPRMVGVQAANCAPTVQAFEKKLKEVEPWGYSNQTVASGIADPLTTYPQDGTRTLTTIYQSEGCGIAVSDESIMHYQKWLAQKEGIFAEPSSATAIAAIEVMKEKGFLQNGDSIVTVVTGHGLKDLKSIR
ncbi:threonine synthase [Halalkalibacter krulwichiae]|uniref:Threonine synthase n=1 Tax=Halalkalibacter krulwichiae TaxID=199441 RepID=A0A1X9MMK5_9BACI|nr:threonine synthase [Halalkalibacter krulwichiae]ARK32412.1 Threonine synthase [Halalkalibacter krulwichiae]